MTARGRLITFEGGEGAGKSTQVARLAASLRAAGLEVVATREPGGTPGGEAIRGLLVEGPPGRWSPLTETLLLLAARHDHVRRVIEPAMAAGRWVLCDRFTDSTRVYQGIAGAVGLGLVDELHRRILGDLQPDLTLVLDLPGPVGLARRRASSGENRFERMPEDYHERVRAGFLAIARDAPGRCVVIDATHSEETVGRRIRAVVDARFGLDLAGAV
ncbi:MAG: tmk [Geminicoccaceae bacterium]|nr:tmk [Geminicoccaceae bacterium]